VARQVQILFTDDLDGSPAESTVRFALDGTDFEIDLNAGHARALRDALAPYLSAARRGPGTRRTSRRGRPATTAGPDSAEVRDWARNQGIDVKDRGRIPAGLLVKFKAANGS
jgi:hypothetical protein